MNVVVVLHTEFGRVNQDKQIEFVKDAHGVSGVSNLISVAKRYGAKVTCMVCPETVDYFPKNAECEIGLHIHPGWEKFTNKNGVSWYAGDGWLRVNCKQSSDSSVLKDYSFDEQCGMIAKGKQRVTETLGSPTCFLAGRWSVNNDTHEALIRNLILKDCSASPHSKQGHYDWSRLPRVCKPYHPDVNDYQRIGNSAVLVIPIAQTLYGVNVNPENANLLWMALAFTEYYKRNMPVFHICCHSPSMTDKFYLNRMEELLAFVARHKRVEFKYVSEISG